MTRQVQETMITVAMLVLILAGCSGAITGFSFWKKWQYDQCLVAGYSETYCKAKFLGCVK